MVKFVYISDMSGNESDPVKRNEDVQRGRARDHHKDLIERLRRCKDGLQDTLTVVAAALKDPSDIKVVTVPRCPERHCIEHTLQELQRSRNRPM